jgi:hypothetical protein
MHFMYREISKDLYPEIREKIATVTLEPAKHHRKNLVGVDAFQIRVGVGGHGEAGSSYSFVSGPLPGGGVGIEVLVAVAAGGEGDDTPHVLLGDGV